ncbi:MAG: carboxypeptidase regulatory-like domain-containing protein [Chitinophagaceae bacterium]
MLPLPSMRQGFITILIGILFANTSISAQTQEDLEKMGREAKPFQFKLKFNGVGAVNPGDAKYATITALLDKYKSQVPGHIQLPFKVQGPEAGQKPVLSPDQQTLLKDQSTRFFREMAELKLTVQDLQRYKEVFKNKNPMPGDNPIDPKIAWKGEFEGIERTLMGGRTLMIMDVWKQTMIEYFNNHPEAVGVVYGQLDIGSWVKMNVDGLGFAADIDFSTIATDAATNQALHNLFGENLKRASGLGMIPIDVVHTAHGLAGAEVFIGEWGKAFAEVDMLRRGKWKLLEMERNQNGQIIDIKTVEKEGKQLFMEKGMEQELKAQKNDPANSFDPKERYPELRIDMEPMLSLEMLRHAIHDIEHGPFEGGQKIIKMIKYTERSFFMIKEALKNVSVKDQMLYFNLTLEEQKLMTLTEEVIRNKGDAKRIAGLMEEFSGKKLESNEQVNLIVDDVVQKCKKAMLKNANQAFGYRVKTIAAIENDDQRFEEADKFLKQMEEEFKKGYEKSGTEIPKSMLRAHTILVDLRAGKIPHDMMNARLEELNKLMEEEYKLDKSFVERLIGDPWGRIKNYLVEKGYGPEAVQKILNKFKSVFTENWRQYAPEYAQKTAMSAYEFSSHVTNKLNSFNEHLAKTKTGKVLSSEILNKLDDGIALWDAWMSGKDYKQSAWNVSWTAGTIWAQGKWPFLAIPLGIYNSIQTRSPAPAAMAVTFYLFPFAGQAYMVTNIIDRLVVSQVMDYNFRNHLDRLAVMAITDGQGHVVRFKIPRAFNGLTGSADSLETDPDISPSEPARTLGIKNVFYDPAFMYCPDIKYFESLIPRKTDQFGMYETKHKNLMTLFAFDNEFVGYLVGVKKFKEEKENGNIEEVAASEISGQRIKMLDSLEIVIEDRLWSAVFSAIESTKRAEKKGVVDELEATIIRIQDSLFMDEWRMKKMDSLSLLLKIRKQIQNDPLYIQALKDKFSAGTAYERVAIPTFERYIQIYRQILVIQSKIFEIWRPFGVDASKLQEDPMRLVLMGGLSGAPMLTTDPGKDLQLAIQCFEAHTKRASDIRYDLATALGRPIKETEKEDKEHLRILGEYGFGFERLVDADANGRSPRFIDETGEIVKKMQEYRKAYQDYLARLKEGPAIDVTLKVEGETETTETNPVTADVIILNEKQQTIPLPAGTTIEWYRYDLATVKDIKVGDGNKYTHDAKEQGTFTYTAKLSRTINNKKTELAKGYWNITVKVYDVNDPSKGIKLKIPALIKQYEIFDVSADIPALLKSRISDCSWGWETIGDNKNCAGSKIQVNHTYETTDKSGKKFLQDSITIGISFSLLQPGSTRPYSQYVNKKVKYQHMSLAVKATDIWEGGSGANWFRLERKPMKNAPRIPGWSNDKKAISTASAYANVGLKDDDPMETINNLEELQKYMEKEAKEQAYKQLEVKPISVGDFKGYGLLSAPKYDRGGWSDAGYRSAGAGSSFNGYVMKGKKIFEVYWYAGAGGAFDNSDQAWMMSMVKQLAAEATSILTSASFQPDGRLTKSPYTGPKLDGSDYPMVTIEPKIDTIQPSSKVSVKAVIKNDKPDYGPYTYSWTGHVEGNSTNSTAQLVSDRPGKKSITVSVDGTTPPGSATIEYVVAPLKVKLTKVSPATNKIIVGMPVELKADFISTIPAGKKLQYLWQPHPEEKFDPFEGSKNTTKVIFSKPGHKKVWVQVLDKTTAETITMGESDQLEFDVDKPAFNITFTPAKAKVGELVTAKINSIPDKLEDVSYRWMPVPANANLIKESQDGSEITFYAKDAMQIALEVLAVVKGSGEELGNTKAYFNAERYTVKTEGPKVQGPKPMIWKPGIGLVEVDKEIAVHQVIEFSTIVTPQPSGNLTYNWQVTEGNASISNPASRDARVTALETGTIQLKVTVKNNNGLELGNAIAVFSATISNEMITNGVSQKKAFDEKMQQARQLLKEGKLDEAIKLGEEVKGMNAKEAAPLINELVEACKKGAKDAAYERDFNLAIKRCEQAIKMNPNDAAAKTQLDQNKKWAKEWPAVLAKGDELESNISKKNIPAGEKNIAELNKLQFNMPGQMANKWSQQKYNKYVALLKSYDSVYAITRKNWSDQYKEKDFENGLKTLETFKNEWTPTSAAMKEVESSIQLGKTQLAEQKRIYDDFLITKSKFEQGLPIDAKQTPSTIETTATSRFSTNDARQKEMIDFARSMDKRQKEITVNKDKAAQLKKDGQKAEAAGQKEEALGKYKESVALIPDPELDNRIKKLETELAAIQAKKNKADELWNEGEKLASKKKTKKDGLGKMKESLEWWNSGERIHKVRELEKEVNGSYSKIDISGVWKHGNTETFTFTSSGNGQYTAVEKGFDNATGSLTMIGETGFINYIIKNGITGQYILKITADGNTATGKWTDSRNNNGARNFVRISKPETPQPDVTKTDQKKKKKSFNDILDDINKGLGKIDSAITGKKPEEKGVDPADANVEERIFYNGNIGGVSSKPTKATVFTLSKATYITRIENYHYYNGGKKPGTIAVQNSNGQKYGPWQAYGVIGQGGVQNATWVVQPKMQLPAGTYTVIDSDPSTWSQNGESKGCGFTTVWAPKSGKQPTTEVDKGVNPADAKTEVKVFDNGNIGGVSSGPPNPTLFTFSRATIITRIENYHYFNGGKKPGTIGLRSSSGKIYGPWQAYGLIGQGGVQNAYWAVLPNIEVPAGTYTVIDSDPSTWSYNSQSKGCGFTTIWTSKTNKPLTNPNDPGYTIEEVETGGGVTAEKIFIAGDIDNLGFGFPKGFDVFSGNATPSHGYPWKINPGDPPGTDRIMVGTSNKSNYDGYSNSTARPENLPQAITLLCPVSNISVRSAVLQMFVDDFQAAAFGSKFTVTINGRKAVFLETVINSLNQTGPVGKLISVKIPADFMNEIQSGKLVIYIDDATSGKGDGYAVDFVRLIINPTAYAYTGTITGIIYRPDGQPAVGASISAGGIINTTANSKGEFTLNNVPAGMVSVSASYNNRHHKTITTDLASGKTIKITITLPAEESTTASPSPTTGQGNDNTAVNNTGILYGTVFKTKEEAGKNNPYDLEGVPLPNTAVTITYIYNSKTITKTVNSASNGKFEFTGLPLNISIRISSRGTTQNKTLTTESIKQYVQFGWDGEITIK